MKSKYYGDHSLNANDINDVEYLYEYSDMTPKDIALKFNVKTAVIYHLCRSIIRRNYIRPKSIVPFGEDHCRSKLTESDVKQILIRLMKGDTQKSIAEYYGVGQDSISRIKNGKVWKQLFQKTIIHKEILSIK